MKHEFSPAGLKPDIQITDIWQDGELTPAKRDAYKELQASGEIKLNKVIYHKQTGMVTFDYLSVYPPEMVHGMLRKKADEITATDSVQTNLLGMDCRLKDCPT